MFLFSSEANLNDLIERSVELCLHASQGGSGTDKGHGSRQLDPAVPAALPSPAKETTASPPSPPSESTTSQPCPPCSPQSFPPPVTCKPQLPCPTLLPDLQSVCTKIHLSLCSEHMFNYFRLLHSRLKFRKQNSVSPISRNGWKRMARRPETWR